MPKESETMRLNNGWKWWLASNVTDVGISDKVVPHTHTHQFNDPFSRTTQVSRYQKGKTNLDFTEARESEWQWHQVCT